MAHCLRDVLFPRSTASWRVLPNAGAPGPGVHPTHQTRAQGIGRKIPAASPRPDRASSALLLFSVVGAASNAARPLCSPGAIALPTLSPLSSSTLVPDVLNRGSSQVKDPASLPLPFPFVPPPSHAAPSWRLKAQLRPGPEPPHPTLVVRGRNPANAPPPSPLTSPHPATSESPSACGWFRLSTGGLSVAVHRRGRPHAA